MGALGPQGPKGEDQQDLNDQEDLKAHQDMHKGNCMDEKGVAASYQKQQHNLSLQQEKKDIKRGSWVNWKVTLSGEKHERIMMLDQWNRQGHKGKKKVEKMDNQEK